MHKLIFIIFSIICNTSVYAQWYETQGNAYINRGNNEIAKTKAIENAIKKALLVSGASVSSVQQVVNGLLTQDEINIRATGIVNAFEVIDETYTETNVTVTIRADIFSHDKQCFSEDYRKSLLITKSHIKKRQQANIGSIYQLDESLVKRLSNKIAQEGMYLNTKLVLKNSSEFSIYNNSLQAEKIKNITMSLADFTDSQYVLFSEIDDISFNAEENNSWQFWQLDEFNRHFGLSIYIYNGSNGELVFEKSYHSSAPWTFSKRAQVDVNSTTFWQSDYGQTINQTLNDVISDIDSNMMCQPTRGKIIQVTGNEISINLGSKHGVKVGDEFSLLHVKNFVSDSGKTYAGFNVSSFTVKITDVSRDSAKAATQDNQILDNIQLHDLAVRY